MIGSCLLEQLLPFSSSSPGSRSRPVSPPVSFPGKTHPRLVNLHLTPPTLHYSGKPHASHVRVHGKSDRGGRGHPQASRPCSKTPPGLFLLLSWKPIPNFFLGPLLLSFPTQKSPGLTLRRDLSHVAVPHGNFPGKNPMALLNPTLFGLQSDLRV